MLAAFIKTRKAGVRPFTGKKGSMHHPKRDTGPTSALVTPQGQQKTGGQ